MRIRSLGGLTLALAIAGCGGDPDRVAAVSASGTVTLRGKPLDGGNVQFVPSKGRAASAAIKDGKFHLTTYDDGDGAVPGSHLVAVSSYKEVKVAGNSEPEQKLITPRKYADPGSSGLTVEIPPGGKTDIEIKLD